MFSLLRTRPRKHAERGRDAEPRAPRPRSGPPTRPPAAGRRPGPPAPANRTRTADLRATAQDGTGTAPIHRDALDSLLPGDDIVVLDEPVIGGTVAYRVLKRGFDITVCTAALVVLAAPMLAIAIKIRSESPGPVIYAQNRVGKNGRVFRLYKFRSMYVDAESRGARWADGEDRRITPFGRFMRRTRVDEIPQLWNIVKGNMSLVGPRPERPMFCREFEKRIHGWSYRTHVTPGLTGLAQVMGGYELLPREKVKLDLAYIRHRGVRTDTRVLLRTIGVITTGSGAR